MEVRLSTTWCNNGRPLAVPGPAAKRRCSETHFSTPFEQFRLSTSSHNILIESPRRTTERCPVQVCFSHIVKHSIGISTAASPRSTFSRWSSSPAASVTHAAEDLSSPLLYPPILVHGGIKTGISSASWQNVQVLEGDAHALPLRNIDAPSEDRSPISSRRWGILFGHWAAARGPGRRHRPIFFSRPRRHCRHRV